MDDSQEFAQGTRVLQVRVEYRIRIHYVEPTYASRSSRRSTPYRWTYRIMAESLEEAKAMAVAEFHHIERLSSGWTREITEVVVVERD